MATFLVDRKKLTVTVHRENCSELQHSHMQDCGCEETDPPQDQCIFCEDHFRIADIKSIMNQRYWFLLLCEACFGCG